MSPKSSTSWTFNCSEDKPEKFVSQHHHHTFVHSDCCLIIIIKSKEAKQSKQANKQTNKQTNKQASKQQAIKVIAKQLRNFKRKPRIKMALNSWSKLKRGTTSAEAISKVQDVQDSLNSTNVETLSRITRHHHPPTGYLQATGHFPSAVSIQQLRLLVSKIVTEVLSPPGHSSVQRTSQPGLSYSPSGLKQRSMESKARKSEASKQTVFIKTKKQNGV